MAVVGVLCLSAFAQHAPSTQSQPWIPSASEPAAQKSAASSPRTTIDPKHQYTLPELVDLAEEHNPATRVAWQAAKIRAGQLTIARSDLLPSVVAAAMAETTRSGILFGTTFVRQTIGDYSPVLRVSYLLFDFGERAGRIEAARDQLLAANFAFNTTHLDVLFDTERRYYRLLNATGQRDAAEVNLKNAQTVSKAVDARLAVGLATLPDALEARASAAQADYELQAAIGQVDIARGDLLDVVGASPLSPIEVQPLDELHLPDKLDEDVSAAVERSLAQRPELGQQLEQKRAAQAAIKEAHSAFLPTLNFSGFGGEVRAYGQQDQLPGTYAGPLEIWDTRLELALGPLRWRSPFWPTRGSARRGTTRRCRDRSHPRPRRKSGMVRLRGPPYSLSSARSRHCAAHCRTHLVRGRAEVLPVRRPQHRRCGQCATRTRTGPPRRRSCTHRSADAARKLRLPHRRSSPIRRSKGAPMSPSRLTSTARHATLLAATLCVTGCARSPVFNVLGSYFPGWIACILLGVIVAAIVRTILHRREWEARIAALPLFYLSLALLVACTFWLIAFE